MPIDPNLAFGFKPAPNVGPDIGKALQNAQSMWDLQATRQQNQSQNALKGILGAPGALDDQGNPTPDAMKQVMGVDPGLGFKLQQNALVTQQRQMQMDGMRTKAFSDKLDLLNDGYGPILERYKESIQAGRTPEQAADLAQTEVDEVNKGFAQGGMFSQTELQSHPTKFDMARFQSFMDGSTIVRDQIKSQIAADKERRGENRADATLAERERHDREIEAGAGKKETWTLENGTDAQGKPIQFRYNAAKAQATTLDGKPVSLEGGTVTGKVGTDKTSTAGQDHAAIEADVRKEHPDWSAGEVALEAKKREKTAGSGTAAEEKQTRFAEEKRSQQAAGTYTNDTAIYDKVDRDLKSIKDNHFPPGTAKVLAERAIAGDFSGLTGFGRSPALLVELDTALADAMKAHDPPLTGADLAKIKAGYQAFTQGVKSFEAGGKLEVPTRNLSVAVDHLDLLKQTARAVAQHDNKTLNALQNALEREFGFSGPPTFDAIKGTVANEIEKAVTGGAGAVADRQDLKESLNKSLSPEALSAVIDGYEGLMSGQLNGLRSTYKRLQGIEGGSGDDFDKKYLSDRARDVLSARTRSGGEKQDGDGKPAPAKTGGGDADGAWKPGMAIPTGATKILLADTAADADAKFDKHFGPGAAKKVREEAAAKPAAEPAKPAPEKASPAPAQQAAHPALREGATATNKKTGERMVVKDGKWVPLPALLDLGA